MVDAPGCMQFEKAMGELARDADAPTMTPAWGREVFMVRQHPQPSYSHLEYREPAGGPDRMLSTRPQATWCASRSSSGAERFFGLRQRAPPHMRGGCSRFELMVACIWRSRIAALGYAADEEVRLSFIINFRSFAVTPAPLPQKASTGVRVLGRGDHHRGALRRGAQARARAGEEGQGGGDVRLPAVGGGPDGAHRAAAVRAVADVHRVMDVSHAGFKGVDFGWGERERKNPQWGGEGPVPGIANYFLGSKNGNGKEGTVVPICLPKDDMEKFQLELAGLTAE
uniref:Benzyl alcohol O-benzoyltransferase n=1 Tax=Triticum urartu TaxID=4572 RepID=A0A8R7PWC6_TRIUA